MFQTFPHSSSLSAEEAPSSSYLALSLSWYSVIKSRTFLSASWNSISSIPSPLYQCKKALRLKSAPNWVASRWKIAFKAVVLTTLVADKVVSRRLDPTTPILKLLGIHSTMRPCPLFLFWFLVTSSSHFFWLISEVRKVMEAAMVLPDSYSQLEKACDFCITALTPC